MGTPGADNTTKFAPWFRPAEPSMAGLQMHLVWQRRQNLGAAANALVVAQQRRWDNMFLSFSIANFLVRFIIASVPSVLDHSPLVV